MINLLDSTLTADEIVAVLRKAPRRPLLPPMGSPTWEAVGRKAAVQEWMAGIRELAEKDAFDPLPPLPDELYALFFKTGERLPFESVYFTRRRIWSRVAMVVLLGDAAARQKFIPALIAKTEEIMGEESWTFPAHVWTVPSGKDPMMIDLFAAETANAMGQILTLFGSIIPEDLGRRIRERLRAQFFENYLKRHAEFTWTSLPMNWNAVCHQGVLGAALAVEPDVEVLGRLLAIAAPCLRIFLGGFGQDGSTSEGPGYWSYGFGWFAMLNSQLEAATDGELSFFGDDSHIKRIATFAPALAFSNGHMVNFSDGHRNGRLGPALLGYLGERLDLPVLRQESAALYKSLTETGLDLHGQRCDLFFFTGLFLRCPDSVTEAAPPVWPDVLFPDYGAVVSRGRDKRDNLWELAAKGGNNDEHHNHNDCGSFILNFNGRPAIIEIGAPEYVHGYFGSEKRYTFLAARSLGHSVPLINGCEQSAGAEFAATVLGTELEAERMEFRIDLTRCYPPVARCRQLIRTFTFQKTDGLVRVVDDFELEEEGRVESMLICEAPVIHDDHGVRIDAPGGMLRIIPGESTIFSKVEVCEYSSHSGKGMQVQRLRFACENSAKSGRVQYEIRAA